MVNNINLLSERGIYSRLKSIKRLLGNNIDTIIKSKINKFILDYEKYIYYNYDNIELPENFCNDMFEFYDSNFGCYYFDIFGNIIIPGSYVIFNSDFGIGKVTSSDIYSLNIRTCKHKTLDRSLNTNVKFIKNKERNNDFSCYETVLNCFNKNMPVICITETEYNSFFSYYDKDIYSQPIYDIIEKKCLDLYHFNRELLPHFVNINRLADETIKNNIVSEFIKNGVVEDYITKNISDFLTNYKNNISNSLNLFEYLTQLKNIYNYDYLNEHIYKIKDLDGKLIKINDMVVTKSIRLGNVVGFYSSKDKHSEHKVKIKYRNFNGSKVYGSQWSIKNLRVV